MDPFYKKGGGLSLSLSTLGCHGHFLLSCQDTKTNVQVQQLTEYLSLNSLSIHPLAWEFSTFLTTYECIFYQPSSIVSVEVIFPASSLPWLQICFIFHSKLELTEFCLLVKHNFLKDCFIVPSIWVPDPGIKVFLPQITHPSK